MTTIDECSTPLSLLTTTIEANTDLTPTEVYDLANTLRLSGFVSIQHNIAAQIVDWLSWLAVDVLDAGDEAECAAFVPGETGRAAAVAERDKLYEAPALWLSLTADKLEKGVLL